jgi:hypothetical protein
LITAPLSAHNTPGTIFSQWQKHGTTHRVWELLLRGPNPNPLTNGLDDSYFDNYSLYDFQNDVYTGIGNTLTPLSNNSLSAANIGYLAFIRGDRSRSPDNSVFPNANNTTLSSRGNCNMAANLSLPCKNRCRPTKLYTGWNPYDRR